MPPPVQWIDDPERAREATRRRGAPLLLDFFNPDCPVCQKMDAATYPDPAVAALISHFFLAVRLAHDHKPLSETYGVTETPTLIVADPEWREIHRDSGDLSPEDCLSTLELGLAKFQAGKGESLAAMDRLEQLLARSPLGRSAAEAVFLLGRARFEAAGDRLALKEAAERLARDFPRSDWAAKAAPYRLL